MDRILDFFRSLWDPATGVGAVLGIVATHLWARFRGRTVTVRWSARVQSLAVSGHHDTIGTVTVLHNGQPVDSLFLVFVEVHNDSVHDLTDLEVQLGFRDGSTFLTDTGSVRGSLRNLAWREDFSHTVDQFLALPQEQRTPNALAQLTSNRVYTVPVLNRGGKIDFLVLARSGAAQGPSILVSGDRAGVRFRQLPSRVTLFGETQATAAWLGVGIGLATVWGAAAAFGWQAGPVIGAFFLGAMGTLVGVAVMKLWRAATKLLS
jgi:hypothetical protein